MTSHRGWSAADLREIAAMAARGATYQQMADRFGVSRTACHARVRKLGAPARTSGPRAFGPEDQDHLSELVAQGLPPCRIAEITGRRPDVVARKIRKVAALREAAEAAERLADERALAKLAARRPRRRPPPAAIDDFALVEGVIRNGIDATAAALGVSRERALARWHELLPVKGVAQQAALLDRLRNHQPEKDPPK